MKFNVFFIHNIYFYKRVFNIFKNFKNCQIINFIYIFYVLLINRILFYLFKILVSFFINSNSAA